MCERCYNNFLGIIRLSRDILISTFRLTEGIINFVFFFIYIGVGFIVNYIFGSNVVTITILTGIKCRLPELSKIIKYNIMFQKQAVYDGRSKGSRSAIFRKF